MKELLFYRCSTCGNLFIAVHNSGVNPICCNHPMEKVRPNTVDGSHEKHLPIISPDQTTTLVTVGVTPHPMDENHHIDWIILTTNRGVYAQHITPNMPPESRFRLRLDEYPVRAYTWCNLHGLWMSESDY